jgi:thioredoxin 1
MENMKKIVLALVVLLTLVTALWLANDKSKKVDTSATLVSTPFSEFKHKIGNEPLMIEFGSISCHSCQVMGNILYKIKQKHPKSNIYFIDIYKDREVAKEFGIRMIPTQKYLNKNGNIVDTHMGVIEQDELVEKLKQLKVL